jgi:hypothetical protein
MMAHLNWDPFGSRDKFVAMWTSSGIPTLGASADAGYRAVFATIRRAVVGRTLKVDISEGRPLTLSITKMDSDLELLGLAVGQFGDVAVEANDIGWDGYRCAHAAATLRNLHFRPSTQSLVAAPVELNIQLPSDLVESLLGRTVSNVGGTIGADAIARLHWRRHPGWGHLEVDIDVRAAAVRLKPRALVVRQRRWTLPAWIPAYTLAMPDLPLGLVVKSLVPRPCSLLVSAVLPEWRTSLPSQRLEDIVSQYGPGGVLDLARSTWRI